MTAAKLKTKKQQVVFLRSAAERLARLGRLVGKLEREVAAGNEKVARLQYNLTCFASLIEDFRAELICSRRDVQEMDAKVNRRLAQSGEIGLRIVR